MARTVPSFAVSALLERAMTKPAFKLERRTALAFAVALFLPVLMTQMLVAGQIQRLGPQALGGMSLGDGVFPATMLHLAANLVCLIAVGLPAWILARGARLWPLPMMFFGALIVALPFLATSAIWVFGQGASPDEIYSLGDLLTEPLVIGAATGWIVWLLLALPERG